MAELKERPGVREVEVELVIGESRQSRRGANLDDVFRAIVWDFKNGNDYTQDAAAARLGLTQQNVARILDEKLNGTSLDVLSRVCIALKRSPIGLFQMHERYRLDEEEEVRYAEDRVYNRFREILSLDDAKALIGVLDRAREEGGLEDLIHGMQKLIGAGRTSPATRRPRVRRT